MLIGYVSDERFVAIPDVLLEFEGEHLPKDHGSVEARSRASGAVYAELPPGDYRVEIYVENHLVTSGAFSIDADTPSR